MKLYQRISSTLAAIDNCKRSDNAEWQSKHEETLADLLERMPSGSGFDSGTQLSDESTPEKLIFETSYHHMDDDGMYAGWTEHTVTITASLLFGFDIKVSGKNRNDIKEYIGECFHGALSEELPD